MAFDCFFTAIIAGNLCRPDNGGQWPALTPLTDQVRLRIAFQCTMTCVFDSGCTLRILV